MYVCITKSLPAMACCGALRLWHRHVKQTCRLPAHKGCTTVFCSSYSILIFELRLTAISSARALLMACIKDLALAEHGAHCCISLNHLTYKSQIIGGNASRTLPSSPSAERTLPSFGTGVLRSGSLRQRTATTPRSTTSPFFLGGAKFGMALGKTASSGLYPYPSDK